MVFFSHKKYNKVFLTTIFLVIAITTFTIYFLINNYKEHRVYNLKLVDKSYRAILFEEYIDRTYKKDSVLFIGDSQPNGHHYPNEKIFTTLLEKKLKKTVLNFSFIDERISDNTYILEYLKNNGMKFDIIIYDANLNHVKNSGHMHMEINNKKDYTFNILKEIRSFSKLALFPNPITTPKNEKIKIGNRDDYFKMNERELEIYISKLSKLILLSKSISKQVVIYPTTHSKNGVIINDNNNLVLLDSFSSRVSILCKSLNVKFFKPQIDEDMYYIDMVHFNTLGHVKMSDIFNKYLTKESN